MIRKLAPFFWPRRRWSALARPTNSAKGFTLLELLVSLAIGSVIVYVMLFAVVELLKTNQREAARSDTQREIQAALDYIARDLREAVYVYDGNCLQTPKGKDCPAKTEHKGLLNYLPAQLNQPSATIANVPVLAFWRVDPLPVNLVNICQTRAADFSLKDIPAELKNIPCVSRRMYTLVVYSLRLNPANDPTWKGKARITRYQLPQYDTTTTVTSGTATTPVSGWISPIDENTTFPDWPLISGKEEPTRGTPAFTQDVLIDFVDDEALATGADVSCPKPLAAITNQAYILTPNDPAVKRRGFYTCVNVSQAPPETGKPPIPTVNQPNQEVVVYINGNAAGRGGLPRNTANLIIPMETRVLTRGALNKSS